jgi:hypothetical protein
MYFINELQVVWNGVIKDSKIELTYVSADGEENYPGEVTATVMAYLPCEIEITMICHVNGGGFSCSSSVIYYQFIVVIQFICHSSSDLPWIVFLSICADIR